MLRSSSAIGGQHLQLCAPQPVCRELKQQWRESEKPAAFIPPPSPCGNWVEGAGGCPSGVLGKTGTSLPQLKPSLPQGAVVAHQRKLQ